MIRHGLRITVMLFVKGPKAHLHYSSIGHVGSHKFCRVRGSTNAGVGSHELAARKSYIPTPAQAKRTSAQS